MNVLALKSTLAEPDMVSPLAVMEVPALNSGATVPDRLIPVAVMDWGAW